MTTQTWNARDYAAHARYVTRLGEPMIDLLAPQPGETILDLGCGDGILTQKLAATGARVIGVDASPDFVTAAQALGVDTRLMDARALDLPERFDAVFSNAALHWIPEAGTVVAGVRRHLKANGRFVGEFGGFGNVAAIVTAILAVLDRNGVARPARFPWYFPTVEEYGALLERHGFAIDVLGLFPRPTPLPTGIRPWLRIFAQPFFAGVAEAERGAQIDEMVHLLQTSLCDRDGNWIADYVRLRFKATVRV